MNKNLSPERWAIDITVILNTVLGNSRFPIDVKMVAREFSSQKFPDDPITMIRGADLPGFEGAMMPAPAGKKGWGILYNNAIASAGRINFTLGHEFGHYLLHRHTHTHGIQCSSEDMARWDSEYGQIEHQANVFAANLLMPLDDFRRQISASRQPVLDELGDSASRYGVSLIAATLRWLSFTTRRSMLVISRDGFILWARSSEAALRTGLYYRTSGQPPISLPTASLAAKRDKILTSTSVAEHDHTVWLREGCTEHVLFSDQYDFTISLLHFAAKHTWDSIPEESAEDALDHMIKRNHGLC